MKDTFAFLLATRFWALVVGSVAVYAKLKGWIGEPEMILISAITGGFTIVRTVDQASEQKSIRGGGGSAQLSDTACARLGL
jgi:hypothetical protein